jgi:hypothetical protein
MPLTKEQDRLRKRQNYAPRTNDIKRNGRGPGRKPPKDRQIRLAEQRDASEKRRRKEKETLLPSFILERCKHSSKALEILGKMPRATRNLPFTSGQQGDWAPYTMPQIFDSSDCIQGGVPFTFKDIFPKINYKRKDVQEVLAASFQPGLKNQDASYAANLTLPGERTWKMTLLADFKHLTIADDKTTIPIGLNLCRDEAIFDFHLDETSNLACLVSEIEFSKVWFFAPLSPYNVEVFKDQRKFGTANQEQIFPNNIERLEKLVCIIQKPEDAIWISTGVLHTTCAVGNGILYGSVFEIVEDICLIARGLSGLFTVSDNKQKAHLVTRFEVVVERALRDRKFSVNLAMAFIDEHFQELVRNNTRRFKGVLNLIEAAIVTGTWEAPVECTCGIISNNAEEATNHFFLAHIKKLVGRPEKLLKEL